MTDRREQQRRQHDEEVASERRQLTDRRTAERRTNHRLELELWFEEVDEEGAYLRCAANVSEGGVYFDHAVPHPVGTTLKLSFRLPRDPQPIVARGEVVSTEPQTGGEGVRFTTFEGDGEQRLTGFIATLAARVEQ